MEHFFELGLEVSLRSLAEEAFYGFSGHCFCLWWFLNIIPSFSCNLEWIWSMFFCFSLKCYFVTLAIVMLFLLFFSFSLNIIPTFSCNLEWIRSMFLSLSPITSPFLERTVFSLVTVLTVTGIASNWCAKLNFGFRWEAKLQDEIES